MRAFLFPALLAFLALVYFNLQIVEAQEKSCKQILAGLTKRQLNGIAGCSKKMNFKSGKEKSKKMNVSQSQIKVKTLWFFNDFGFLFKVHFEVCDDKWEAGKQIYDL